MKFSTPAHEIQTAIKSIIPAIGRDGILSHVAMNLDGSNLTLSCTNHEITLTATCQVATELDGSITVPAKKLYTWVGGLDANQSVSFTQDANQMLVKSGRTRAKLSTLSYEDFPSTQDDDATVEITIDAVNLRNCISETKHAMGNKDVRYYLNGMKFEVMLNKLRAVATDGHRLSTCEVPCTGIDASAIIPRSSVGSIERILTEGDVVLNIGSSSLQMKSGGVSLTTKLIDGRYPDWTRVVPGKEGVQAYFEVDALKSALQRVIVLSNEQYHGVRLSFEHDKVTLSTNNPNQEEAIEEMDIAYDGPKVDKGYNIKYLSDVLSVIDGECSFYVKPESGGVLIVPSNESPAEHVVMEMRL